MQAKKTVAFEVWEQLGRRMPDVVYLPVGDGVTLAAFVHGCEELVRCGVADRLPRVVGVQASGAAPLVAAFEAGRADVGAGRRPGRSPTASTSATRTSGGRRWTRWRGRAARGWR